MPFIALRALVPAADAGDESNFVDISVPAWAWVALLAFISFLLLLDILVIHRKPKVLPFKRAAVEWACWAAVGLGFTFVVGAAWGRQAAGEYISGYLIEQSLSIDNVFVWALIFASFAVPLKYQHRVLFWGIFGALMMRAIFIFAGVALIERFEWILFVFGGFLIVTAIRLVVKKDDHEFDPQNSRFLRLVRRVVPSTPEYHGQKLFVRENAKRLATPLFAVLVLVETTDVVFAVDSVPAVLAVSREQFIVFASNAFAILGLRALYFLLADMRARFSYLQQGLAVILAFVGVKMIISHWHHIETWVSLLVIVLVFGFAILMSLAKPPKDARDTIDDVIHIGEDEEALPPPDER